jgi:hypothetical protein
MGAEKNKKCNEKISVLVCRIRQLAEEAGGNAPTELPVFSERTISLRATTRSARGQSGFCSKKVRISTKRYRQFTISEFSEVLRTAGLVASPAGEAERAEFESVCHAPRGEKEMFWFWIWKFVWALPKAKQSFATNLFLFRLWRNLEAIIFNNILTYDKLK